MSTPVFSSVPARLPSPERFKWFFRVRGLLMVPPVLFMLLATYRETEWDSVVMPAGLAVFFLGMATRVWAQVHLHYRLRVRKVLTQTGPYRYLRNPIYVGNTLLLVGLCIMSELLWFIPLVIVWCVVVYSLVVRYEESHLINKYGDPYQEFLDSTPRWIPRRPAQTPEAAGNMMQFLLPSVVAELHCLLLLLPFLLKEFIDG